jgi:hypothetical protein
MAVSVVPALVDALVAAAVAAVPAAKVYDGFGVSDDPGDFLMIGVDDPDGARPAQSASTQQEWAYIGATDRWETGDVTCAALSWNGDGNQKAARDAAYETAEALASALRANPSLGLSNVEWTGYGTRSDLTQTQDDSGALALLVFQVNFKALI